MAIWNTFGAACRPCPKRRPKPKRPSETDLFVFDAARSVCAVEIDKNLIPILEDTLSDYDNVEVINNDVLKVDLAALAKEKKNGRPIKVVANLPYYITTPIIMGLFENQVPIDSITIMVQKEVADRMQVGPGTKDYGALSLAVQYYAKPKIVANIFPLARCFSTWREAFGRNFRGIRFVLPGRFPTTGRTNYARKVCIERLLSYFCLTQNPKP